MGKGDFAIGNSSTNPFTPPRQMAAHAASIVLLLELIQRKRKGPQRAVEIGCWQAQTSRWLLTAMPYLHLSLVDPLWVGSEAGHWHDSFAGAGAEQMQKNVELVEKCVADFAPRVTWHRELSVDGAKHFEDGSQDLVFIDAGHTYENVRDDIAAWKSKVRPGGYLSFHDWKPNGLYGKNVGRAVREMLVADPSLTLQVFPGKVAAVRIPPYERMHPVCPMCSKPNAHKVGSEDTHFYLGMSVFDFDHWERQCSSCGIPFSYQVNPANEFHCFKLDE
jgi:predicted O-methyltransferase YrrM